MAKLVSKVYGEALFEVAVDHGNAIRLMNETAELQKILEDNPDFDKLMKHPGIPKQEKLSMVEKVFPGQDKRRSGRIFEDRGDQGTLRFIKGNFCLFYRTGQRIGRNGNRIL